MTKALSLLLSTTLLAAAADTIYFRDGRTASGSYLGGDARQIRVVVGEKVQTYAIADVQRIEFGGASASTPPPVANPRAEGLQPSRINDNEPPPPSRADSRADSRGPSSADIPAGTNLVVRLIDPVDSQTDRLGQTYRATLDEPIVLNGETVVDRGADITAKLVEDTQSGKLTGKTVITLDLVNIKINGRFQDIDTEEITRQSGSRTAKSAKVGGGLAALGAIIGGIAGGGKGAAIGAVSGAGAGGAAQVLTKGERVRIPSETRLTFLLQNPVRI